jgi:NADPH:quinone reductase-like Zn-dependent oxidoreductase
MTSPVPRPSATRGPVTAALITQHGQPPRPGSHRLPPPTTGECLVRVTAAPITPLDLLCATGTSYFGAPALPYVPGVQGVGVVLDSHTLRPGTRVWFNSVAGMQPGDGSLAEAAVAVEADTVPLPDGLDDIVAAALGLSAVAAWMALTWKAQLRPGERVLVLGAGGVVGQVAAQAALALGASQVIAASRRPVTRERSLARGATSVVDLADADVDELESRMRDAAGGPVDVVIDPVCGHSATAALRLLGEGGRLVHLGASGGSAASFSSAALRSGSHSILGYTNNSLTREQRSLALTRVFELSQTGGCDVVHKAMGLDEVTEAWTQAGASPDGRIVVVPAGAG